MRGCSSHCGHFGCFVTGAVFAASSSNSRQMIASKKIRDIKTEINSQFTADSRGGRRKKRGDDLMQEGTHTVI